MEARELRPARPRARFPEGRGWYTDQEGSWWVGGGCTRVPFQASYQLFGNTLSQRRFRQKKRNHKDIFKYCREPLVSKGRGRKDASYRVRISQRESGVAAARSWEALALGCPGRAGTAAVSALPRPGCAPSVGGPACPGLSRCSQAPLFTQQPCSEFT